MQMRSSSCLFVEVGINSSSEIVPTELGEVPQWCGAVGLELCLQQLGQTLLLINYQTQTGNSCDHGHVHKNIHTTYSVASQLSLAPSPAISLGTLPLIALLATLILDFSQTLRVVIPSLTPGLPLCCSYICHFPSSFLPSHSTLLLFSLTPSSLPVSACLSVFYSYLLDNKGEAVEWSRLRRGGKNQS